jgi:hypothetical protein
MITYLINICVDTKSTDIYDKVAINKFPIILRAENDNALLKMLNSEDIKNYIKISISKQLYENADFYIRYIPEKQSIDEKNNLIIKVKQCTVIEYD